MAYKSVYSDIIFIEGNEDYQTNFGPVVYKKDRLYNNQLQNIDNVKSQLAQKAKEKGGNAIINFKYGQKNTSWFRSLLLQFDDNVNWFGEGEIVLISQERYNEIINDLKEKGYL